MVFIAVTSTVKPSNNNNNKKTKNKAIIFIDGLGVCVSVCKILDIFDVIIIIIIRK